MRKSQSEKDRAAARLQRETQIPVASLSGSPIIFDNGKTLNPHTTQLLRWGMHGMRGVFLDVMLCGQTATWVTSREAVARFVAAVGARAGAKAGG